MRPFRTAMNWLARSPVRTFVIIFLLGFSVRLFFLSKFPERYVVPHDRWEDTAIAMSLVQRGEFADPYRIPTGPTAHLPPLVPGITAFFWKLFGLGPAGGYAAWIFALAMHSALYALLPWFGRELGVGAEAGVLGGIAGALIVVPPGNAEGLTGLVLGLLAVAFLRRWTSGPGSVGRSLLLGAACGTAFHLQPALLPVVLGWMLFELGWSRDRRKWALSGCLAVGMFVVCVPWGWRNYVVFGELFFIRGNLGLELRMGNHEGAAGAMDVMDAREEHRHPRTHLEEARLIVEVGEAEYMRRAHAEAIHWIRAHPGEFLRLTGSRFTQFWLGPLYRPGTALAVTGLTLLALLGAWRSRRTTTWPQRAALAAPLIFYPLIYYVVAYMPRYRVPLDWILLLLAGAAIGRWLERDPSTRSTGLPR